MKKVSLLIPVYNEEQSIPLLYPELTNLMNNLKKYEWEILFVNDGSTDNTLSVLRELHKANPCVCYVDLSRNYGKEVAMLAGFDYVTGDCTIILDADLQDPPSLIPEMLEWWEKGYDDVYGRRRTRGQESWLRKTLSLLFYRMMRTSSRLEIVGNVGDFRLLSRRCIQALQQMREHDRYTKGLFFWIGYKKKELLFDRCDRVAGRSSSNYRNLFGLAVEGFTSFSIAPLRIASYLGFGTASCAIVAMLFYLIKTLVFGDPVHGFPTLIIIILLLGGLQLLCLGIIGEYLGRVFNESKHRPVYFAQEYNEQRVE